jgi:hypothetical protein
MHRHRLREFAGLDVTMWLAWNCRRSAIRGSTSSARPRRDAHEVLEHEFERRWQVCERFVDAASQDELLG